jgi:hypothetical protein
MPFHLPEPTANYEGRLSVSGKNHKGNGELAFHSRKEWRKFKRGHRFIPGSEWGDRAGEVESELVCRTGDGELALFFPDWPPDPIA